MIVGRAMVEQDEQQLRLGGVREPVDRADGDDRSAVVGADQHLEGPDRWLALAQCRVELQPSSRGRQLAGNRWAPRAERSSGWVRITDASGHSATMNAALCA